MMMSNERLGREASCHGQDLHRDAHQIDLHRDVHQIIFDNMHLHPRADTPHGLHTLMGRRPQRHAVDLDHHAALLPDVEVEE